jgi:hypothetical protein
MAGPPSVAAMVEKRAPCARLVSLVTRWRGCAGHDRMAGSAQGVLCLFKKVKRMHVWYLLFVYEKNSGRQKVNVSLTFS